MSTTEPRDLRLDLARGIALWFIFLDHVPDNIGAWLTIRNYGFSDTTEIFFFVSGYTCALAYGRTLREQGLVAAAARSVRRAVEIYAAFLLTLVAFAIVIYAVSGADRAALDATNTAPLFASPGAALMHAALLHYMPVNTDVLPTFVLLHLLCAPLLWLMSRAATLVAFAGSLVLYILVQATGFNFATWPKGEWFFNPLAWQLLFVFGAWTAMGGAERLAPLLRSRAALTLAIAYLLFGFVVVLGWHIEPLAKLIPEAIKTLIYPIDKSSLAPLRVLHFMALALVALRLMPYGWRWLESVPARSAIRCGEQSLTIYCLGVPLAFIAGEMLKTWSGGVAMQLAVSALGVAIMVAAATAITWTEKAARRAAEAVLKGARAGNRLDETRTDALVPQPETGKRSCVHHPRCGRLSPGACAR